MSNEDDFQSSFPYNNPIITPNPHSFNKPKLSLNPNSLNPNSKTSHLFSKPYNKGLSESTIDRFLLDSVEEKDTNCYLSNSIEPTVVMEFGRRVLKEKGKRCYFSDSVESRLLNSVDPIGDFADKSERADMEFSRGVLKENVKRFNFSNSIESKLLKSVEPLGVSDKKMVCSGSDIESGCKVLNEKGKKCYLSNSVESRLLKSGFFYGNGERDDKLVCSGSELESGSKVLNEKGKKYCSSNLLESRLINSEDHFGDFDDGLGTCSDLDVLLKLCDEGGNEVSSDTRVFCPLCRVDISYLPHELREEHTNDCLDNDETPNVLSQNDNAPVPGPGQVVDVSSTKSLGDISPVIEWLRGLNLAKYEEIFAHEEIDWDTLQWLTEDDLLAIGISALGPRKKIVHALSELRKGNSKTAETRTNASSVVTEDRSAANKLITDFFPGFNNEKRKESLSKESHEVDKSHLHSERNKTVVRKSRERKLRDIPQWCCIPGTPFRVDAFKYLRSDCSYWFLTHFHIDHYQGLARSFSHGKLYCSLITAKLVNVKIGIPWERLQILPLNQKINIAGIDVTCFDANHCPGAIILLFEPPSAKAVLHTGDFRYSQDMTDIPVLQTCRIQTLVLDTTYCNPQFDFPKQEAVIQFVIEAIQAEAFNQTTLFLIGSYTIGKERLFLEVARVLRRKVYVGAAKLRILECLGIPMEDMQWFTSNEQESHIHVVPMWTLASFKRLKCISNQYSRQYSLIVAFSPTGWTFGKGKKKSTGRRWQQGTIVRYEVPYSEHSSFTELQEFVKFISPQNIIPSVNNDGPESANAMVSLLLS